MLKLIWKWFSINIRVIEVRKLLTLAWMWYWCWCPIFITLTCGVKGRIERSIFALKCFSKLFTLVSTRYFDNNNNVFINFVGPEKRVIYKNSALNFSFIKKMSGTFFKGIFPSGNSPRVFSLVATSQMCIS